MKILQHYLALVGAIALGTALRFWNLDFKPLWMDEVITALFSLGQSYNDIPLNVAFPLSKLEQIFTLKPGVTCPQIAHTVATQSTHPPLFFCLMYQWLKVIDFDSVHSLAWKLRSLPALAGVGAIAAIYCLNRVAFSPAAGLAAAAVIAVSPFAVYLSQEARHYTLPMLLIILALFGLIQIQKDVSRQQQTRPIVWLFWTAINSINFYVHYFSILAFTAQVATFICPQDNREKTISNSPYLPLFLLPFAFFLPGIITLIGYSSQNETDWLKLANPIAPLYQTLVGWLIFTIALPVEKQPLWIQIPAALLMILFASYLWRHFWWKLRQLCSSSSTQTSAQMLRNFIFYVLIQNFIIVYLLGKDITLAPRYNYVYFPALCALIGASLVKNKRIEIKQSKAKYLLWILLLSGIMSSVFVTSNLAFQKPYHPQKAAADMSLNSEIPLLVTVGYKNFQDVALGLSFALEIRDRYPHHNDSGVYLAFLPRNSAEVVPAISGYKTVWESLSLLQDLPAGSLNLWVVGTGLNHPDYPPHLSLLGKSLDSSVVKRVCNIDLDRYHSMGVSYQLYRCQEIDA